MKHSLNKRPSSLGLILHSIGLAVVVVVVGVYYCLVYGQIQDQAGADVQRIEQLARYLQTSGPVNKLHRELQVKAETLGSTAQEIRARLAQPLNGEELSKALHSIATESGLELSQLTMDNATSKADHRQSEVRLQCTGSYASMCLFLEGVSKSQWIADVTQLTVTADDEDQDHKMLATLTIYYDLNPSDSNKT